jgi:uncharacterized membrane-anchored protein
LKNITPTPPRIEPVFWFALCCASICGANLGDLVSAYFPLTSPNGLIILSSLLFIIFFASSQFRFFAPLFYWLAILTVRAAATILADMSLDVAHLAPVAAAGALAILLAGLTFISGGWSRAEQSMLVSSPRPGALYWLTMLVAGVLGTVVADGLAHLFPSPKIGVPIAAALGTFALVLTFQVRKGTGWAVWTYWLSVVVIRAWGTSVGDAMKFLLTMPISIGTSAVLLALAISFPRSTKAPAEGV